VKLPLAATLNREVLEKTLADEKAANDRDRLNASTKLALAQSHGSGASV
jgi:hypothetical protein